MHDGLKTRLECLLIDTSDAGFKFSSGQILFFNDIQWPNNVMNIITICMCIKYNESSIDHWNYQIFTF